MIINALCINISGLEDLLLASVYVGDESGAGYHSNTLCATSTGPFHNSSFYVIECTEITVARYATLEWTFWRADTMDICTILVVSGM